MTAKRHRIIVEGWPVVLVRKPGKAYASMLKADKPPDVPEHLDKTEAAAFRVKRAQDLIARYAEIMGWTLKHAKARIDLQRLHNLANPPREISQEYDL